MCFGATECTVRARIEGMYRLPQARFIGLSDGRSRSPDMLEEIFITLNCVKTRVKVKVTL